MPAVEFQQMATPGGSHHHSLHPFASGVPGAILGGMKQAPPGVFPHSSHTTFIGVSDVRVSKWSK